MPESLPYLEPFLALFGQNPRLQAVVLVAAALVVGKLTDWAITRWILAWTRKTKTDLDDRFVDLLHRPLFWSVVLLGSWLAVHRLALTPGVANLCERLLQTAAILVWVGFGLRACGILLEVLSKLERRSAIIEPRTVALFDNLMRIVLACAGVYFLFLTWGIDVGALIASLGIAGIAVGFAAQETLSNFIAGITLLIERPFTIGDWVQLGGRTGRVEQITLRTTRMVDRNNVVTSLPNASVASSDIVNLSAGGPLRIGLAVGIAYKESARCARSVLMPVVEGHSEVLAGEGTAPAVLLEELGDSSVNLTIYYWIAPEDIAAMAAWLASDEAGFVSGQFFTVDGAMTAASPIKPTPD